MISIISGGVSANTNMYVARGFVPGHPSKEFCIVYVSVGLRPLFSQTGENTTISRPKKLFIGNLNLAENYGTIRLPPIGRRAFAGQILVEVNPIR